MHALSRLIRECRRVDPSLSYFRIAELSGGLIGPAAVGKWANEKTSRLVEIPHPDSIRGLARGLNVQPWRVLVAAAEATGITIDDFGQTKFANELPPEVDNLPLEIRHFLKRLIWALTNSIVPEDQKTEDSPVFNRVLAAVDHLTTNQQQALLNLIHPTTEQE
jgi:hypothetical protein